VRGLEAVEKVFYLNLERRATEIRDKKMSGLYFPSGIHHKEKY